MCSGPSPAKTLPPELPQQAEPAVAWRCRAALGREAVSGVRHG